MNRARIVGRVVAAACVAAAVVAAPGVWTAIPAGLVVVAFAAEVVLARRRRQAALAERFRRLLFEDRCDCACTAAADETRAAVAGVVDLPRHRRPRRDVRRG